MKHLTRWLAIIALLSIPLHLNAAIYYVANNGNDANDGLSPETAWQTLERLGQDTLTDNSKILFKRGDTFRGTVSLRRQPKNITFDAYGEGASPVLAGSVVIKNWKKTTHPSLNSNKVYEADVTPFITPKSDGSYDPIQYLFVGGKMMTIARFPNVDSPKDKGWLKVEQGGDVAGSNSFISSELAGRPYNYWKGAVLRIRNYSWTFRAIPITASTSTGKITAAGKAVVLGNGQLPEWGYFIDDKLEELDYPGEWYYDQKTRKIYLYPKSGNPNDLVIEGMWHKKGINLRDHQDGAAVQNLTFRHYVDIAVAVSQSNDVTVQNNIFTNNMRGVKPYQAANIYIAHNYFDHQIKSSLELFSPTSFDLQNAIIEKNYITNNAMYICYGQRYDNEYGGIPISVFHKGYTVRKNFIDTSSYVGISLHDGGKHVIEKNLVMNALSLLNDGGAIIFNAHDNIVSRNFALQSVGNTDESNGCMSIRTIPCLHHPSYGMGIGANSRWYRNTIEKNTAANNGDVGIRLNAFQDTIVRNNLTFNNDLEILVEDKKGTSVNNSIEGNIFMSLHPKRLAVEVTSEKNHGIFNRNQYCNPYRDIHFKRTGKYYSLGNWRETYPQYDQNSRECKVNMKSYNSTPVGGNLLANGGFDVDLTGWSPVHDNVQYDAKKLDGGTLKVVYPAGKSTFTIANQDKITLKQGHWYRFSFKIQAEGHGNVRLAVTKAIKPTYEFIELVNFPMFSRAKEYEHYFQAPETTDEVKIQLTVRQEDAQTYWMDNIELTEVSLQDTPLATDVAQLFMNPTDVARDFDLGNATYKNLDGQAVTGSLRLAAYASKVLVLDENSPAPPANVTQWDSIVRELVNDYVGHLVNPDAVLVENNDGSTPVTPTPPQPTTPDPLAAPQLTANVAGSSVDLAWGAVPNATHYEIVYSPAGQTEQAQVLEQTTNTAFSTSFPAGAYDVAVYAQTIKDGTETARSPISNVASFTIASADKPQLTAAVNGNQVTLSWTSIPNAETYFLYYAPYPNAESLGKFEIKGNSVSGQLAAGAQYYFAVIGFSRVDGKLVASEASNVEVVIIPK